MAELEAEREEKRLNTQIRKPADAAAYEKQVQAEAERVARISIAEAEAREVELAAAAKAKQIEQIGSSEARIVTARGLAEGEATKAKGEAEGASIRAKGLAEAEAIAKRAEALEKEADAVIGQQIAEQLPEIVRAASESFKHVDNLTVLNGAQGISEIIAQVIGQAGPALEMAQGALVPHPQRARPEGRDLAKDLGPGAARIAVIGLERHRQARILLRVGRGEQPHGAAAVLVGVERPGGDAAARARRTTARRGRPGAGRAAARCAARPRARPASRGPWRSRRPMRRPCSRSRCAGGPSDSTNTRRGDRDGGQRQPRRPRQAPAPLHGRRQAHRHLERRAHPGQRVVHRGERAQLVRLGLFQEPVGVLSHRSLAPAARRASSATRRTRAS